MLPMPDPITLEKVLNDEKDTLEAMLKSARTKDQEGFVAAATRLMTVTATSVPIFGPLASEGAKLLWAQSTYAQATAALDTLEAEQQEDDRARKFAQLTAALMGEALFALSEQLRNEHSALVEVSNVGRNTR